MAEDQVLARKITLPLLIFYGLGNILGAGIYVLIGKVAQMAGIFTPVSFLVALIIVSFTALSYTELASRFPVAAGEAVYVEQGLHLPWLSIGVGIALAVAGVVSSAAIVNGFSGYLIELVDISKPLSSFLLVLLIGTIAVWGIGESVKIAAALTFLEIGGLLIIIGVGIPVLKEFPEQFQALLPSLRWNDFHAIVLGGFLAFYAFIGFEDMVNIAEEVKAPRRTFPKAIIIALSLATLLYLLVSLVSVLLVSPAELASTDAPFALLYKTATGRDAAVMISVISIVAIVNGALIQIIMAARILYGMSSKGWLPKVFSSIYSKTRTPAVATVFVSLTVLVLALWFPLTGLANMTSTLILIIFTVVNIALVRIKLMDPHPPALFTVPLWIPITGALLNILFLSVAIFSQYRLYA